MRRLPLAALLPVAACAPASDAPLAPGERVHARDAKHPGAALPELDGEWTITTYDKGTDPVSGKLLIEQHGASLHYQWHAPGEWFAELHGAVTPDGDVRLTGWGTDGKEEQRVRFDGVADDDGIAGVIDVHTGYASYKEMFAEIY